MMNFYDRYDVRTVSLLMAICTTIGSAIILGLCISAFKSGKHEFTIDEQAMMVIATETAAEKVLVEDIRSRTIAKREALMEKQTKLVEAAEGEPEEQQMLPIQTNVLSDVMATIKSMHEAERISDEVFGRMSDFITNTANGAYKAMLIGLIVAVVAFTKDLLFISGSMVRSTVLLSIWLYVTPVLVPFQFATFIAPVYMIVANHSIWYMVLAVIGSFLTALPVLNYLYVLNVRSEFKAGFDSSDTQYDNATYARN